MKRGVYGAAEEPFVLYISRCKMRRGGFNWQKSGIDLPRLSPCCDVSVDRWKEGGGGGGGGGGWGGPEGGEGGK